MKKEMIMELNAIAAQDFEKAKAMIEGINLVLGTDYDWLNKRVVFFDKGYVAHDAYAWAEE